MKVFSIDSGDKEFFSSNERYGFSVQLYQNFFKCEILEQLPALSWCFLTYGRVPHEDVFSFSI